MGNPLFSAWSIDITWNAERAWWEGAQAWKWDHWAQAFAPMTDKDPQGETEEPQEQGADD